MSIKNRFKSTSISGNFAVLDTTDIFGNTITQSTTKIQRDLLVGQTITCNNLISNTGLECNTSGQNTSLIIKNQGSYIDWNRDNWTGKSYFINARGLGAGGFEFQLYDGAGNYMWNPFYIEGTGDIHLNAKTFLSDIGLYLRSNGDTFHGIQYIYKNYNNIIVDGPSIFGFYGGQLGYNYTQPSLTWSAYNVIIYPETDSNGVDEGSLICNGGIGCAKNLFVGGLLCVSSACYINGNLFEVACDINQKGNTQCNFQSVNIEGSSTLTGNLTVIGETNTTKITASNLITAQNGISLTNGVLTVNSKSVSPTQLSYLSTVSSNIQDQFNARGETTVAATINSINAAAIVSNQAYTYATINLAVGTWHVIGHFSYNVATAGTITSELAYLGQNLTSSVDYSTNYNIILPALAVVNRRLEGFITVIVPGNYIVSFTLVFSSGVYQQSVSTVNSKYNTLKAYRII